MTHQDSQSYVINIIGNFYNKATIINHNNIS